MKEWKALTDFDVPLHRHKGYALEYVYELWWVTTGEKSIHGPVCAAGFPKPFTSALRARQAIDAVCDSEHRIYGVKAKTAA